MLIGELAEQTGISPRLLRYYEQQGLLDVSRHPNGYRDYDPDAVTVVRRIRGLLDAGLNTETIRTLLPCVHGEEPSVELCAEVDAILRRELGELQAEIDRLTEKRDAMSGLLLD
ncbi:MerR family transcriptional regulator [Nocardia cyriacigeorgica]|uniref:MerR family transcriptional regulator n=1 Tax=Nocardia cyriacigeorgica TaxID=135487 RepID=A0A6P1D8X0_9NOCA|nr:MerR family transcriptional regulator [Nocardia cyriacigeorgica]NEW38678.1 MerR family transcriptional regulator [Nocardia cyriacigeorgica]NEW46538.1 MerR family transcriptional regulator [Nocardia cyriacigeorgica]NEW53414.1 MerR family transcriptional regulator [Nocardia cyriacigeorgica]NEW59080.1 MerR family transcriptional regulator [Nocardia cyriacigeorgica]